VLVAEIHWHRGSLAAPARILIQLRALALNEESKRAQIPDWMQWLIRRINHNVA
jgi:hypothetical protein